MKVVALFLHRRTGFILFGLLLAALIAGQYATRGVLPPALGVASPAEPGSGGSVDQSSLIVARRLALEARTPAEQQAAAQALRLADHQVDQAFQSALRNAATNATPLKGEALQVSQNIAALNKKIAAEKQHLADLAKAQPKAADQDDAAQQIELAQAQMDLDNDELNDLHQDLVRLGGDKHAKIQQALDEHEATQKQSAALAVDAGLKPAPDLETMPGKLRALMEIRGLESQLHAAGAAASSAVDRLSRQHEALEQKTVASTAASASGGASAAATIDSLHALSGQRKTMMEFDTQIHDEQQLAAVYQSWGQLVSTRGRAVLNLTLRALTWIAAILLAAFCGIVLVRRRFARQGEERRRFGHLRIVAELLVELLAVAMILIVVFGTPTQMPALLGLATAGITIVMKDFIVAFIGWFALMGKNGIRVGDWVEINGVSGEVVQIGMLRTILLETGNLADTGHPTGRRVTFMNSFAIEGRYFNFSTSGQWLWDELRVSIPLGDDAYTIIETIRQLIADATQHDAAIAEQEWRLATKDEALRGFSAAPTIDLRPASSSIEVTVRYITRAQKRFEVRSGLYQEVIRALHYEEAPQLAEKV